MNPSTYGHNAPVPQSYHPHQYSHAYHTGSRTAPPQQALMPFPTQNPYAYHTGSERAPPQQAHIASQTPNTYALGSQTALTQQALMPSHTQNPQALGSQIAPPATLSHSHQALIYQAQNTQLGASGPQPVLPQYQRHSPPTSSIPPQNSDQNHFQAQLSGYQYQSPNVVSSMTSMPSAAMQPYKVAKRRRRPGSARTGPSRPPQRMSLAESNRLALELMWHPEFLLGSTGLRTGGAAEVQLAGLPLTDSGEASPSRVTQTTSSTPAAETSAAAAAPMQTLTIPSTVFGEAGTGKVAQTNSFTPANSGKSTDFSAHSNQEWTKSTIVGPTNLPSLPMTDHSDLKATSSASDPLKQTQSSNGGFPGPGSGSPVPDRETMDEHIAGTTQSTAVAGSDLTPILAHELDDTEMLLAPDVAIQATTGPFPQNNAVALTGMAEMIQAVSQSAVESYRQGMVDMLAFQHSRLEEKLPSTLLLQRAEKEDEAMEDYDRGLTDLVESMGSASLQDETCDEKGQSEEQSVQVVLFNGPLGATDTPIEPTIDLQIEAARLRWHKELIDDTYAHKENIANPLKHISGQIQQCKKAGDQLRKLIQQDQDSVDVELQATLETFAAKLENFGSDCQAVISALCREAADLVQTNKAQAQICNDAQTLEQDHCRYKQLKVYHYNAAMTRFLSLVTAITEAHHLPQILEYCDTRGDTNLDMRSILRLLKAMISRNSDLQPRLLPDVESEASEAS
ncbi:hypothetical protein LTS15_003350 [Exophiala xenobiotica]|nr:hypothetical protein LTS15_003350 [Exophiala xenobiotica]